MNNIHDIIYFAKVLPTAKIPTKREEDACYDLWSAEGAITLAPYETKLIDTGIATAFPSNYVAIIKERSSWGSKNILLHAGVINSGYRNSWKVCLTNLNEYPITLPTEKAIAQFLLIELPKLESQEVNYDQLLNFQSERGIKGFGSTDKK